MIVPYHGTLHRHKPRSVLPVEHPVRATFLPGAQNENIETRKALPGGAALLLLLELLFQLGDEFVDAPGSFLVRRQSGRFLISGDLMLELLLVHSIQTAGQSGEPGMPGRSQGIQRDAPGAYAPWSSSHERGRQLRWPCEVTNDRAMAEDEHDFWRSAYFDRRHIGLF